MQEKVYTFTDTAMYLVGDPTVFTDLIEGPLEVEQVRALAEQHGGVLVEVSKDGTCHLVVCVDEPAPEALRARARSSGKGRLRIPSGTLLAGGPELFDRNDPSFRDRILTGPPRSPAFCMARLPPGDYECEALLLDDPVGETFHSTGTGISIVLLVVVQILGTVRRALDRLLVPLTLLAVATVLFLVWTDRERAARLASILGLVFAIAWLARARLRRFDPMAWLSYALARQSSPVRPAFALVLTRAERDGTRTGISL